MAWLAPKVEVLALAAEKENHVDGTRPAEHAAARPVDAAPGQSVAGLGLVAPVGGGIVHRLEVADGDMDPGIPVARPRLQQKHAMAAVRRQPVGEDASRRAGAGDDVVVGRSEEHTSELQSLMRISYAVFCLKKK